MRLNARPRAESREPRATSPLPLAPLLAALLLACASQGAGPPGGPPDALPPELVATVPESASVRAKPSRVVFEFNEVVSERPAGAATLGALFLVSPRDGEPRVDWKRKRVTVRPRHDWKPNTVYTVTMLPGMADLRGNVRKEGATVVFSTGPTIPATRLAGVLFDWPAGRVAPRALVQAYLPSDTTVMYVGVADSTGQFELAHLPPGRYTVRGVLDANNNRVLDRREGWDSVSVQLADSARVELLAFVHDTIGPRINTVTVRDSLTLRVSFDKPLDPSQSIGAARFRLVTLPDSAPLAITSATLARAYEDSARARSARTADSARRADTTARRDTAAARPAPARQPGIRGILGRGADTTRQTDTTAVRPSRPVPETDVVLVLAAPLRPATNYRLTATEIRNLLGIARTSDRSFSTPKPQPADTTAARRDTTKARRPAPGAPPPRPGTQPPPPPAKPPAERSRLSAGCPPPAGGCSRRGTADELGITRKKATLSFSRSSAFIRGRPGAGREPRAESRERSA